MSYRKTFDPPEIHRSASSNSAPAESNVYVFDDKQVILAVNVAMATGRPLLVFGPPGCGKSSLGPNIAGVLGWRWQLEAVSARTEPEDLLWRFDAIHRLNDAQGSVLQEDPMTYYKPGLLWNAFEASRSWPDPAGFVAVIDEIDKADPDVPSSLLTALGALMFDKPWGDDPVFADRDHPPLIVITTNDERQLSAPFLRRCVTVTLAEPTMNHLHDVAKCHFGDSVDGGLVETVARMTLELNADLPGTAYGPSTAEFLDTLKACVALDVSVDSDVFVMLCEVTMRKRRNVGTVFQ
jgi:MoxR-like ATPase